MLSIVLFIFWWNWRDVRRLIWGPSDDWRPFPPDEPEYYYNYEDGQRMIWDPPEPVALFGHFEGWPQYPAPAA